MVDGFWREVLEEDSGESKREMDVSQCRPPLGRRVFACLARSLTFQSSDMIVCLRPHGAQWSECLALASGPHAGPLVDKTLRTKKRSR